jgi:magnesium transporter
LAYAVFDTIVDAYYPVLESIGDYLERLENAVLDNPSNALLHELNRYKNRLFNLRRSLWPQRESVNSLIRDPNPLISDNVRIFLRDTYDHCVQTTEIAEMYREMVSGLMNMYLSSVANRTNDVMKVLTIVATVFIPLTFIAGIYGMNFEYMPELSARWAYPILWCVMGATASAMLIFFYSKGWLGGRREDKFTDDET